MILLNNLSVPAFEPLLNGSRIESWMAVARRFERMSRSRTNHRKVSLSTSGTVAYAMTARANNRGIMNLKDNRMASSFPGFLSTRNQ